MTTTTTTTPAPTTVVVGRVNGSDADDFGAVFRCGADEVAVDEVAHRIGLGDKLGLAR
jgi:hypothetical protein